MKNWLRSLRLRLSAFLNTQSRKAGPTLTDECVQVIMRVCALQLERSEQRELAPTKGAHGPMLISGGAITTVKYVVFDRNADRLDRSIREEPWRAFSEVTMVLSMSHDPEFTVTVNANGETTPVEPTDFHKAPGLALVSYLARYFPLLPKPHQGPVIKPEVA